MNKWNQFNITNEPERRVRWRNFYNLDRTLTGNQTLELLTTETPGAVFGKQDNLEPQVFSYDVDINGQIYQKRKPC